MSIPNVSSYFDWIFQALDFVSDVLTSVSFGGVSLLDLFLGILMIFLVYKFILHPLIGNGVGSDKAKKGKDTDG